jgi:hypothetical protein
LAVYVGAVVREQERHHRRDVLRGAEAQLDESDLTENNGSNHEQEGLQALPTPKDGVLLWSSSNDAPFTISSLSSQKREKCNPCIRYDLLPMFRVAHSGLEPLPHLSNPGFIRSSIRSGAFLTSRLP